MTFNQKNYFNLSGRTALVTGGGGILGRRFSGVLANFGASVAVLDVDLVSAEESVCFIKNQVKSANIFSIKCNVGDPIDVASAVNEVVRRFGSIDILINNAATKSTDLKNFFEPFETYSLATWREVMAINIDGMFLMAQAVGRQMLVQGRGGSIVQTASIYGAVAPDQRIYEGSEYLGIEINTPAVYAASKAAVIGLSNYLAAYWGSKGIRVNSISPGGVQSGQNETFIAQYSERVPLRRMAKLEEIEAALLFLVSDASSYVTGHNLVVDGGLTCW